MKEKKVRKNEGVTKTLILKYVKHRGIHGAFVDNTRTRAAYKNSLNAQLGISAQLAHKLLKRLVHDGYVRKFSLMYYSRQAARKIMDSCPYGATSSFRVVMEWLLQNHEDWPRKKPYLWNNIKK